MTFGGYRYILLQISKPEIFENANLKLKKIFQKLVPWKLFIYIFYRIKLTKILYFLAYCEIKTTITRVIEFKGYDSCIKFNALLR